MYTFMLKLQFKKNIANMFSIFYTVSVSSSETLTDSKKRNKYKFAALSDDVPFIFLKMIYWYYI